MFLAAPGAGRDHLQAITLAIATIRRVVSARAAGKMGGQPLAEFAFRSAKKTRGPFSVKLTAGFPPPLAPPRNGEGDRA